MKPNLGQIYPYVEMLIFVKLWVFVDKLCKMCVFVEILQILLNYAVFVSKSSDDDGIIW